MVIDGTRELRLVLTTPDYDAALPFYRDVLGLREEASFADDNGGRATLLHAGRATIELCDDAHAAAIDALEVGHRSAGPVRLAFEVIDAATTADRLVEAGGGLIAPPVRTPWGSLNARLQSPDGQQLTVYSTGIHIADRPRLDGQVVLAEPDPTWPAAAAGLLRDIRGALGPVALVVEHVGSTSVPGLPAKPIIDLVLGVSDPADEAAYVPGLESAGYRLHLREPEWFQHRLLKRSDPSVNLHVFAAGEEEIDRMLAFRDHLRGDECDRALYLRTKRELAARTWSFTQDYADAKGEVVADVLHRAMARQPRSLRGCFVVVSGVPGGAKSLLARALASGLGLPLVSHGAVVELLLEQLGPAEVGDPRPLDRVAGAVVLRLAEDSGGAVVETPWTGDRASDVATVPPGLVVEISCTGATAGERAPGGWPVLEQDVEAPCDIEALIRRVRQVAGSL